MEMVVGTTETVVGTTETVVGTMETVVGTTETVVGTIETVIGTNGKKRSVFCAGFSSSGGIVKGKLAKAIRISTVPALSKGRWRINFEVLCDSSDV